MATASKQPKPAAAKKKHGKSGEPNLPNLHDAICCRAYELYEERGRVDGHHDEDWLRAEAEVRAKFAAKKSR